MNKSKIGLIEATFVVGIVALVEILEVILTFAFGVGEVVKWLVNIAVWLPVQFWLMFKGARGDLYAISILIEFIPFLNALPIKTALLIATIYIHNHPESVVSETVHKASFKAHKGGSKKVRPKKVRHKKPKIKKKSKARIATKVITKV